MYQPATRAFDGVDYFSVPPAAPVSARPLSRTFRLADLDLVVDLGADIGSARWWQGLGTLGFLSAMAITLALRPAPFTEPAQPALGAAGIEQLASVSLTPLATTAAVPAYSPSARVMALVEPPERPRIEVTARLREVDSFNGALRRAGVSLADTANVAILVAAHTDVRSLKPGTTFDIVLGRRSDKTQPRPLESLSFRAAFDLALEVTRTEAGDLVVTRDEIAVDDTPLRVTGDVGNSLYKSARAMGLPSRIVAKFIKALSAKVNFQRDVGSSDNFDLIVEHRRAETGETETGDLLYARLDGRKDVELLRWTYNGAAKFFLPDGSSAIEGMIGSPIAGARLSSGFGMRFHPILRRTRMHAGVDYSAGYGTPVLSTAPGRVVFAGRNGGYGNQVRVAHNNGIITTYSHLSKIAANVGERVAAGERIGNVGSTGLSTGPHLHYEVLVGGRNVNPRSTKLPLQEKLSGSELARFKAELERMRQLKPLATSHDA